jgi:hypothetical protein
LPQAQQVSVITALFVEWVHWTSEWFRLANATTIPNHRDKNVIVIQS